MTLKHLNIQGIKKGNEIFSLGKIEGEIKILTKGPPNLLISQYIEQISKEVDSIVFVVEKSAYRLCNARKLKFLQAAFNPTIEISSDIYPIQWVNIERQALYRRLIENNEVFVYDLFL